MNNASFGGRAGLEWRILQEIEKNEFIFLNRSQKNISRMLAEEGPLQYSQKSEKDATY